MRVLVEVLSWGQSKMNSLVRRFAAVALAGAAFL
jgi:hypothetical protein